jgi:hypothetical protein
VLQRQLAPDKVRFAAADRAFLAALLHRLPRPTLRSPRLLVRPDTILRWHRDLLAGRHAARSHPQRPGRPPTVRSIRALVLHLAKENPHWGYRRVHGKLLVLGITPAASTVWEMLTQAGIDPAPGTRHHLGRLLTLPSARPTGLRFLPDLHPFWHTAVCIRGDRARPPPDPDSRCHRAPDPSMGDPSGA